MSGQDKLFLISAKSTISRNRSRSSLLDEPEPSCSEDFPENIYEDILSDEESRDYYDSEATISADEEGSEFYYASERDSLKVNVDDLDDSSMDGMNNEDQMSEILEDLDLDNDPYKDVQSDKARSALWLSLTVHKHCGSPDYKKRKFDYSDDSDDEDDEYRRRKMRKF